MDWFFEKTIKKMYFMGHLSTEGVESWFMFDPTLNFSFGKVAIPAPPSDMAVEYITTWSFSIGLAMQVSKFILRLDILGDNES